MAKNLEKFLRVHGKRANVTNTSLTGGRWTIDEDIDEFYNLYANALDEDKTEYHFTELHYPDFGPIVIDFDFKMKEKTRQLTPKYINSIVDEITGILYDIFDDNVDYTCFVLQRPAPYKKDGYWKDGIHFQFPNIVCDYTVQFVIRERFINSHKLGVECIDSLDKIYDKSVIKSSPWCMYGSTKAGIEPYEIKWILNSDIELKYLKTLDLVRILSIRNKRSQSIISTNSTINTMINTYLENKEEKKEKRIRDNDPDGKRINNDVVNKTYDMNHIIKLLDLLKVERVEQYDKWYRIILILHYISKTDKKQNDYLAIAHTWSKKSINKYDKTYLNTLWKTLNSRIIAKRPLSILSLNYYAKEDNPEGYQKLSVEILLGNNRPTFPNNELSIGSIISVPEICLIQLNDRFCPFYEDCHRHSSLYIEVSKNGIILKCKECTSKSTRMNIPNYVLSKVFNINPITKILNGSSDDILLMNRMKYVTNTLSENRDFISEEMIKEFKNKSTVIMQSPTGSGKTTAIRDLVDNKSRVLSIVSRRSMAHTHKKSFKELKMTSYLDDSKDINRDRFIISLEQLYKVDSKYDILILDEITSLLNHLYSSTMRKARLVSFLKLIDLIINAKKLIVADAIITDTSLDFITSLRGSNVLYYRNKYPNKTGVNLKIYYRKNNTGRKDIELLCEQIIPLVKEGKSVMIMSDSRSVVIDIYNYLLKYNNDKDYFKVYTKEIGSMKEIRNCNKLWLNKCVIFSPKIIYGVDILILYEHIFAIYTGTTMDSFSMLQQISRARAVKNVHVLFTMKHYRVSDNNFISYEENKRIEELELNKFIDSLNTKHSLKSINEMKENIIYQLQAMATTARSKELLNEINENSIFGRIHLYVSWYKKLYSYNKSKLFIQLCMEQGYTIKSCSFGKDSTKTKLISVKKRLHRDCLRINNNIILQEDIEDDDDALIKYSDVEEAANESLKSRMSLLRVTRVDLINDDHLRGIVIDERRFNNCISSIILYFTKEACQNKELESYARNFAFIEKSTSRFKLLKIIEWLEDKLDIDRFKIGGLEMDLKRLNLIKAEMIVNIHLFQAIGCTNGEASRINEITTRINNIESIDRLQKFFAEIINKFDKIYPFYKKRVGKEKTSVYVNFIIDQEIIKNHIKIINQLRMSPNKFRDIIKARIIKQANLGDYDLEFID